jgi:heat shock protein HspQ
MIAPAHAMPKYQPGQLVQHRRYGYRGVVVAWDRTCQAPDKWYESNQTQPLRWQPWYHVLVHGANTVTYAAETSLESDDNREPIIHPLLDVFFEAFTGDAYERNDHPWPGWQDETAY